MRDIHDILTPVVLADLLVGLPDTPALVDIVVQSEGAAAADAAFESALIGRERVYARTCVAIARHRNAPGALSLANLATALNEAGVDPLFGGKAWNTTAVRRAVVAGVVVDDAPATVGDVLRLLGTANPSGAVTAVLAADPGKAWDALAAYVRAEAKDDTDGDDTDGEGADGETDGEGADDTPATTDGDIAVAILNALKGWQGDGTVDAAGFVAAIATAIGA